MKNYLVLLFALTFYTAFGQDNFVNKKLYKINLLAPSIESELGLTNKTTLDFKLGTGLSINGGTGRETDWSFFPFAEVQYRYFYNLEKRAAKNKRTANNSGNYLALSTSIESGKSMIGNANYAEKYFAGIGPIWGMQRSYKSGFSLNLSGGLGLGFSDLSSAEFMTTINFSLGWVIGK
ncbi:MAG: hypothetical protein COB81_03670 [Flavobacteriaceae bacterium]|nr:MAG: hypothetical protein COB81_03670 [Flavobacteriaceae bacterium]